jgi:quercetin dioxygenase-like cupin family protein
MDPIAKFLPETETTVPIIRGPGEGKVVGVLRDQSTFKVLSEETGGAYAILEQKIPPGHGPPLHVHRHETEIFYVLEGELEITIGGQKVTATAGAIVVGPRDIPHAFRNVGSQDAPASHGHPGAVRQLLHRCGWRRRRRSRCDQGARRKVRRRDFGMTRKRYAASFARGLSGGLCTHADGDQASM